jgi:hypothetical protein
VADQDPLIERLAGRGGELPNTTMLVGFVQETEDYTRIYMEPSGGAYIEVRSDDIVHSEQLERSQTPLGLGGSVAFVSKDAALRVVASETVPAQQAASFLQGGITGGYLPQADMGAGSAPPGIHWPSWLGGCASQVDACPSALYCPTRPPLYCPTFDRFCLILRGERAAGVEGQALTFNRFCWEQSWWGGCTLYGVCNPTYRCGPW